MNEIEVAAMWTDTNISYNQVQIILRHFCAKFKMCLQVPFRQIFTNFKFRLNDCVPKFGEYLYQNHNKDTNVYKASETDPTGHQEASFIQDAECVLLFTKHCIWL